MGIRKTVTEEVLLANRANAKKSTGPHDKEKSRVNSFKHGLLSKKVHFRDDEDRAEFNQLVEQLQQEQMLYGAEARVLVEDAALCIWKLRKLAGWDFAELEHRRAAGKAIMTAIREGFDVGRLELSDNYDGTSPISQGWDCESLTVRSQTTESEQSFGSENKSGHIQIEARLCSSLETLLKYQITIKRDLYRALSVLREIRRDRRGEESQ